MGALKDAYDIATGGGGGGKSDGAAEDSTYTKRKKQRDGNAKASPGQLPELPTYHRGGKVRKTGPANLKKGEVVLTEKQAGRLKKRKGKRRSGKKR